LRDHEQEINQAGARLAAVGLGGKTYAAAFKEETGISFPLLVDHQRQAYRAVDLKQASMLHLLRRENAKARKRAAAGGHRQHRLGKDPFQLGGSFVFGPGNVDLFAHVSETFGDNASVADLVAAVRT
jgi:hypothetical protein